MKTTEHACVILGSLSGIAREIAKLMASRGIPIVLVARSSDELKIQASDLKVRYGGAVETVEADAQELEKIHLLPQECSAKLNGRPIGSVILCWGIMPEQKASELDPKTLKLTFDVNLTASALVLQSFANMLKLQGGGTIVGISSVAGDRGRGSNYLYGATKAGLTALLDGMRHRYHGVGLRIITVKPGIVSTPMTKGIINPNSPLCASPHNVAADIVNAIETGASQVYTPRYWRIIMAVIRNIPEILFLKSKL
jgi:short-subunit dehydrogenase